MNLPEVAQQPQSVYSKLSSLVFCVEMLWLNGSSAVFQFFRTNFDNLGRIPVVVGKANPAIRGVCPKTAAGDAVEV
jgi:hypothetical protein